jgi:hypothetical protein
LFEEEFNDKTVSQFFVLCREEGNAMSGIQAVIFDLDGTLIDSEPNYFEAEKKLLAEYGITGFDFEMKKPYVGISTKEMLEDLNKKYPFSDPVDVLIEKKNRVYTRFSCNEKVFAHPSGKQGSIGPGFGVFTGHH